MNHHHTPPYNHRPTTTTAGILKQTTAAIFTTTHHHLLIFSILSFLILSLRSNVELATQTLTQFIDHDPSIKSLISRLPNAVNNPRPRAVTRRRRPFLQLTRVGTLDDDFFSGDDDLDHRFFATRSRIQTNLTKLVVIESFDYNLPVSKLKVANIANIANVANVANDVDEEKDVDDLEVFLKRFELEEHEMSALLFLLGVLSVSYGFAIFGFVVTYAWVLGIIFVVIINDLLKGDKSFFRMLWDGSNLGLKRLSGYIVMRWAVRDALTQVLGVWFFGEVEDQYVFFKIFVRLKLMPFSIVSPWVKGFEREVYGFLLSWFLLDTLVSFVFAVDAWIAMVDTRKSVREVVKEGCHLLSLMIHPAINLKCLEGIVCGSFARWVISGLFGKLIASVFQSFMEVYFMVAWLFYYLSVKSKDASSSGVPFGNRELERLLEDVR